MKRRLRLPGTLGRSLRVEIATAVDPTRALIEAANLLPLRRCVWVLDVRHDGGSPVIGTEPIGLCACEVIGLDGRRAE